MTQTRTIVRLVACALVAGVAGAVVQARTAQQSQVTPREMRGVRNLTQVTPTVACAGATDTSAIARIAHEGFKTIINLRLASERGADVDEAREAARAAGIRYIHLPYETENPAPGLVDRFLAAVNDEANHPVFIHCASAGRVAGLWLIKRVVSDGWDVRDAEREALAIGLANPRVRDFAMAEIAKRKG